MNLANIGLDSRKIWNSITTIFTLPNQRREARIMPNTSNAGNVEQNGLPDRLNPREIAMKLFRSGEQTVSILNATDEQFEAFRLQVGIPVKECEEGKKWSFDNRCRAINHALKYGLKLPFIEGSEEPPDAA
jgi:hypothetical protein